MQKTSLIAVTFFTLLLTSVALLRAGWFEPAGSQKRNPARVAATRGDLFASDAGWFYRRAQPAHWKYLVLKR
jgi:hypothetical protein